MITWQRYAIPHLISALTVIDCGYSYAQPVYPNKAIRIVTPGTGGGGDFAARMIAPSLTIGLGQQIVVDNRPSGIIPGDLVAKSPPDGYTLLMTSSSHWLAQFLQNNVPYDPIKDFAPVSTVVTSPNLLVVNTTVAAMTVQELIALAKSHPGELNYASIALGSPTHLAAELFKAMAGVNIVRVPYKASGAALSDLMGGQVQLMFSIVSGAMPHVRSGRLRALAVTSAQPSELAPGIITVAAAGLPGYESMAIFGIFAPAATPGPIISRLNRELVKVLSNQEIKDKFLNSGVEAVSSTPDQLIGKVKREINVMGKVIKDGGIRSD